MELPDFFIEKLKEQYEQKDVDRIIEGLKKKRKVTLRVNTINSDIDNVKQELNKSNIHFEDVKWSKEALVINAQEKDIEKLDIYKNGEVYLQSLSSMLPPIIMDPKENEDILDMAAAPGGKTTQIAALTDNKAHITACEMNKIRAEKLKYNIKKQGATSVYVMETDSRRLNNYFSFDRILLDSPCSGSGTLSIQDKRIKEIFTEKLIKKCQKTQLELLTKAIKVLKPGKEMVYSTCSILKDENEDIVEKALQKYNCKIVPINFEGLNKIPLLPSKILGTITICTNEFYEGFFIAKILKKG